MTSPSKRPSDAAPKFQLITNVSEFGLLQTLARSRARLIVSAIVGNAVLFGLTLWVSDYIIHQSASVGLNLALITASMLVLLATSYVEAMLLGDLFFPGRWRERVLLGRQIELVPGSPEAIAEAKAGNTNALFLIVLACMIVANYFSLNALTGDYLDTYHRVGFHLTHLRSDSAEDKVTALREISKAIYADIWNDPRVSEAMLTTLKDDNPEVQRWALWTLGQARMTSALDTLTPLLDAQDPATQAEAALAIGKLRDKRATPTLTAFLTKSAANPPLAIGALRGLALLGDPTSGPAVVPLLDAQDPETRAYAAWALGKLKHTDARPALLKRSTSGSPADQCTALDALKFLTRPDDAQTFKDRFLLEDTNPQCPWIIWETLDGTKHYIAWKESHRAKYMKIVFNSGTYDVAWLETVASDRDQPDDVRLTASNLVRDIKKLKLR